MHFSNSLNETHLYFPIQMYLISWGYILLVYCTCVHWGEVMLRIGRLLRLYTIQPHFENKQKPKSHTLNTQWSSTRSEDLTKSVFIPRSIVFFLFSWRSSLSYKYIPTALAGSQYSHHTATEFWTPISTRSFGTVWPSFLGKPYRTGNHDYHIEVKYEDIQENKFKMKCCSSKAWLMTEF